MRKIFLRTIVIGFLSALPFSAMAWGALGHRIVGEIADSYLTKKARKAIEEILGNESIAMASNWADFTLSAPHNMYPGSWHYINIPPGQTESEVMSILAADTGSVYTRINFLTAELKNKNLSHDLQVTYLRLLIHFVEDIHQPLHTGRQEDKGGNSIKLTWMGNSTNLHTLWDSQLINFQQLSYTEYAAAINFTTKEQRKQLYKETVADWIWTSYQQVEKIYAGIQGPEPKLSYEYNYNNISLLNNQLLTGGVHLAGLLNEIFD